MGFRAFVLAAGIATGVLAFSADSRGQVPGPTGNAPAPRTPLNGANRTAAIEHLDGARDLLGKIDDASLTGDSSRSVGRLRLHFSELGALYHASDGPQTGETVREAKSRPGSEVQPRPGSNDVQTVVTRPGDWRPKVSEVERDLTGLIGGGPSAGAPGAAGATANSQPADAGLKDLNPAARKLLQQFRRELELFYAATLTESGGAAIPK